ncbi:MAG: EamA family transporter [Elusimicrobia bacterium]|nr:EamA family transporter [Elusimicrobiota bacterium]
MGHDLLAIKVGVREMPPLLFSGVRFCLAGVILTAYAALSGRRFPARADRGPLALAAALMLGVANSILAWALMRLPSGVASLLVAITPLWLVLLARAGGERVTGRGWAGVALGLAGVAVLSRPDRSGGLGPGSAAGVLAVIIGTGIWAWASLYTKRRPHGSDPIGAVAFQKLVGGATAVSLGLLSGEGARWHPGPDGWLALFYLTFAGSVIGFTAYTYALAHLPTERVAVYAYVNPVVAVSLGVLLAGERVDAGLLLGAPLVLAAVWLANGGVDAEPTS